MKSQLDGPRDALRAIEDQKAADARAAKSKVPKVCTDRAPLWQSSGRRMCRRIAESPTDSISASVSNQAAILFFKDSSLPSLRLGKITDILAIMLDAWLLCQAALQT